MSAIIYTRFSPRPNGQDCMSIETQLDRCRALCTAKAWPVLSEHQDRELSGGRADNRPGLQAALEAACQHKAAVVVYSLSRLARNTKDAIAIAERLAACGADLFSLHETIDTTSATGRFTFTLFAALATLEREQIGERTSDAMKRHQSAGRRMTRPERTPYGWVRDPGNAALMVKDMAEQSNIGIIMDLRESGLSAREICARLDKLNVAPRNERWHHALICNIIARHSPRPVSA